MNRRDFNNFMNHTFAELRELNKRKGHDYAGDEDAFANFKRHADLLDLTPEQVWAVYAGKHWDAIMTYVKEGDVKSEPVEGRIKDILVYSLLLLGMIHEKTENKNVVQKEAGRTVVKASAPTRSLRTLRQNPGPPGRPHRRSD